MKKITFYFFFAIYWFRRSRPRQPARRRLHQRPAPAQPRPAEDHRDGRCRRQALRHFASTSRQSRMRFENSQPISGEFVSRFW